MQTSQTIERDERNAATHAANLINAMQSAGYQYATSARLHDCIAIRMRDVTQTPAQTIEIKIEIKSELP